MLPITMSSQCLHWNAKLPCCCLQWYTICNCFHCIIHASEPQDPQVVLECTRPISHLHSLTTGPNHRLSLVGAGSILHQLLVHISSATTLPWEITKQAWIIGVYNFYTCSKYLLYNMAVPPYGLPTRMSLDVSTADRPTDRNSE